MRASITFPPTVLHTVRPAVAANRQEGRFHTFPAGTLQADATAAEPVDRRPSSVRLRCTRGSDTPRLEATAQLAAAHVHPSPPTASHLPPYLLVLSATCQKQFQAKCQLKFSNQHLKTLSEKRLFCKDICLLIFFLYFFHEALIIFIRSEPFLQTLCANRGKPFDTSSSAARKKARIISRYYHNDWICDAEHLSEASAASAWDLITSTLSTIQTGENTKVCL